MLTGRKPFPGEEWARVFLKLQSENPEPLTSAEAPAALASIVLRCLEKDAALRYQSFGGVAADLLKFQRQYQTEPRRLGLCVAGTRLGAPGATMGAPADT